MAQSNNPRCPRCGGRRIHRHTQRIKCLVGVEIDTGWYIYRSALTNGSVNAGWYVCLDCWNKWDGIADHNEHTFNVTFPTNVVRREDAG